MDTVLEHSYSPLALEFDSVKEEVLNRAVRVKKAVMERIGKNFVVPTVEPQVSERTEEKVEIKPTLPSVSFDDILSYKTEENISKLEPKVRGLELQGSVLAKPNRAVLYTRNYIEKNKNIFNKWFKPLVEKEAIEEPTFVPDTWDLPVSAVENSNEESNEVSTELPISEEIKEPVEETASMPTEVVEQVAEEPVTEEPVVENEMPVEPPKFDFSMPTSWEREEEITPPEPVVIPTSKVDLPLENSFSMDTNEEEKDFDLGALNKPMFSFNVGNESNELESAFNMPVMDENRDLGYNKGEDDIPSKTAIMARVKRASSTINEKNAKISDLEGKISNMDKSISDMREKVNSYETVTRDLAKANNGLTSENEQLRQRVSELDERYKNVMEESDKRVTRDKLQHAEELATLRTTIESLKEQHQREKDEITNRYEKRLSDSEKHHKAEMKALWASISSALGENVAEEEQEYRKVA